MSEEPSGSGCALCERSGLPLTRHHLIPRTRHRNKRNKREFDRDDVRQRVLLLCRDCHAQVHALLDEKQLEREYNTRERLLSHPQVARFVEWLRGRTLSGKLRVLRARRRR